MINSEKEYTAILNRIEELLYVPENVENQQTKGYVELNLLSDLLADYEELHYPIQPPTLPEAIKLRMHEHNQKALSQYSEVSSSRISEYLNGKSDPTLKVARK